MLGTQTPIQLGQFVGGEFYFRKESPLIFITKLSSQHREERGRAKTGSQLEKMSLDSKVLGEQGSGPASDPGSLLLQ